MSESRIEQDGSRTPEERDLSGGEPTLPPPGVELETFVEALTPPNALVWRTLPLAVPWTRPPGGPLSRSRPRSAQLVDVLAGAGVTGAAAQEYVLRGPYTEIMVYSPRELDRNHGHAARAIEVAAEHDIAGSPLADIASRLSLTDHEVPLPRQPGTTVSDPRGGRRYLRRGRLLLNALGVWPWAHVDDWVQTRRWWRDPTVLAALYTWHDHAWLRAAEQLAYSARHRYGTSRTRAITGAEYEACLEFRERLVALAGGPRAG